MVDITEVQKTKACIKLSLKHKVLSDKLQYVGVMDNSPINQSNLILFNINDESHCLYKSTVAIKMDELLN